MQEATETFVAIGTVIIVAVQNGQRFINMSDMQIAGSLQALLKLSHLTRHLANAIQTNERCG